MGDIARGWDIVWANGHASGAVWIALLVPVFIAVWFAIFTVRGKRKDKEDFSMRPKPRAPLPGPDRGFR